jgi:hypothetical protein
MVGEGVEGRPVNCRILNSRTPGTTAWRLHGYIKGAPGIVCMLIRPDGARISESLAVFAKQAGNREWDNDPRDIQAMLELATTQEMRHE